MSKYFFTHADAVELLYRVIAKYENFDSSFFDNIEKLEEYLNEIEKGPYCEKITNAIRVNNPGLQAKALYNLSRCVRSREAYIPLESTIRIFKKYIGDSEYKIRRPEKREWKPSEKKISYAGTTWWIYSYDEIIVRKDGVDTITPILNRGILKFKSFSKVEINNYSVKYKKVERYIGEYNLFDGLRYFILDLRTEETLEKFLKMTFFIGSDSVVPLALGIYNNIDGTMYSGTVMMVRQKEDENNLPVKWFKMDGDGTKNDFPAKNIVQYFSNKNLNRIRVPAKINSEDELDIWLKSKNKTRN